VKYRPLLSLVVLLLVGTLLTGCGGTPTPPVDSIKHLQELVQVGQTLDTVQELMTDALKDRMTIYPARDMEKQENGNWIFKAKEGGSPGDTDAPYLAIVIEPDPGSNMYFSVFLKDRQVMTVEWFDYAGVFVINTVLGNFLDLEGTE
jgi:hypothetical protein